MPRRHVVGILVLAPLVWLGCTIVMPAEDEPPADEERWTGTWSGQRVTDENGEPVFDETIHEFELPYEISEAIRTGQATTITWRDDNGQTFTIETAEE